MIARWPLITITRSEKTGDGLITTVAALTLGYGRTSAIHGVGSIAHASGCWWLWSNYVNGRLLARLAHRAGRGDGDVGGADNE